MNEFMMYNIIKEIEAADEEGFDWDFWAKKKQLLA